MFKTGNVKKKEQLRHQHAGGMKGNGRKQLLSKTMCEPNFSCPLCEAAFVRIDSMQSHLRQHQKLQPELEQEIFSLQQQILHPQQGNNQQSIRTILEKSAKKIIPNFKSSKIIGSQSSRNSVKLSQIDDKSSSINKRTISSQEETVTASSIPPSSVSVASNSMTSDCDISPENVNSPITLIVSPPRTENPPLKPISDMHGVSSNNFQRLSYIRLSSTPTDSSSTTAESNVTTLSIPVAATEDNNASDGVALLSTQVPVRTLPFTQELSQRRATLGSIEILRTYIFRGF